MCLAYLVLLRVCVLVVRSVSSVSVGECSARGFSLREGRLLQDQCNFSIRRVLVLRVQSKGECASARGPKDTFEVEGRTGAHVESEVVLKCEGNTNEGACDMLC